MRVGVVATTSTACATQFTVPAGVLKAPAPTTFHRLVALTMIVNLGWAVSGAAVREMVTADGASERPRAYGADEIDAAVCFGSSTSFNAWHALVNRPPDVMAVRLRLGLRQVYHSAFESAAALPERSVFGALWCR